MIDIRLLPVSTEKSYAQSMILNTYVFEVPIEVNKMQIKSAVEEEYRVAVSNVRTLVQNGKKARSIRLKSRPGRAVYGVRSDKKKAYVTLKAGESLPIFADTQESKES